MKNFLFIITVLVGLVGCQKPQESIQGYEYKLTGTPQDVEITIAFSKTDNRFFGRALNRYFGTYQIKDHYMTLGPVGSTMMAGPQEIMKAESDYFKDLAEVQSYKATQGQLILVLKNKKELVFNKIGSFQE